MLVRITSHPSIIESVQERATLPCRGGDALPPAAHGWCDATGWWRRTVTRRTAYERQNYRSRARARNRWCPSIACMKGLQCATDRLRIEPVDKSQTALGKRQRVEQTNSYAT